MTQINKENCLEKIPYKSSTWKKKLIWLTFSALDLKQTPLVLNFNQDYVSYKLDTDVDYFEPFRPRFKFTLASFKLWHHFARTHMGGE